MKNSSGNITIITVDRIHFSMKIFCLFCLFFSFSCTLTEKIPVILKISEKNLARVVGSNNKILSKIYFTDAKTNEKFIETVRGMQKVEDKDEGWVSVSVSKGRIYKTRVEIYAEIISPPSEILLFKTPEKEAAFLYPGQEVVFTSGEKSFDADGDGVTNLDEIAFGSNPLDKTSFAKPITEVGLSTTQKINITLGNLNVLDSSVSSFNNVVWIIYKAKVEGEIGIYFSKFKDGYKESEGKIYSTKSGIQKISSATDNSGNVHIVYSDASLGNYDVFYTSSTDSFQVKRNLSISPDDSFHPFITIVDGKAHIAWSEYTTFSETQINDIFYLNLETGEKVNITKNTGTSSLPQIKSSNGNLYFVWLDNPLGSWDIFFSSLKGQILNISQSLHTSDNPVMEIDKEGNIWIFWEETLIDERGKQRTYIMYSTNIEGYFSSPKVVVEGREPKSAHLDGKIYLVFYAYALGDIMFTDMSAPESILNISNSESVTWHPSISASGGKIHLTYIEIVNNIGNLVYTSFDAK